MELAYLCARFKRRYADAALLYGKAFDADPGLARKPHGYRAAAASALAGCGRGEGAGALTPAERAALRGWALDLLRAELGAAASQVPELQGWLEDPALSGVRDAPELAQLPASERDRWAALWTEVSEHAAGAAK